MDKKNTGLDIHDRRRLAHEARHIQGSLSALLALEKNNLSEEKIRKIVNDIYTKTDNFLELLDSLPKKIENQPSNGKLSISHLVSSLSEL